jgi:hypothetical protein
MSKASKSGDCVRSSFPFLPPLYGLMSTPIRKATVRSRVRPLVRATRFTHRESALPQHAWACPSFAHTPHSCLWCDNSLTAVDASSAQYVQDLRANENLIKQLAAKEWAAKEVRWALKEAEWLAKEAEVKRQNQNKCLEFNFAKYLQRPMPTQAPSPPALTATAADAGAAQPPPSAAMPVPAAASSGAEVARIKASDSS